MQDTWESAAFYEAYIGRWSREVARSFIAQLAIRPGSVWLDVGCGSGALTAAIVAAAEPATVLAMDRSLDFVQDLRRSSEDTRSVFVAADAADLPFASGTCDAAVSGLVLNFVRDPLRAVREMLRCVRARGTVAIYLWDYSAGMQTIRFFWDAATAIDPAAASLDEARRFPLCRPDAMERLFADAGAGDVSLSSITVPMHFRSFEDVWSPFLGGQGPAPTYAMSLPDEGLAALRERFRAIIPAASDGSIDLSAKAWVMRARKI